MRMLALVSMVSGCLAFSEDFDTRLGGTERVMNISAFDAAKLDALRERVAADFGCATKVSIDRIELDVSARGALEMYRVTACDRREIYGLSMCLRRGGWTAQFVPISTPIADPEQYAGRCSGAMVVAMVDQFAALNAKGAIDLHCPRPEVIPAFVDAGARAKSIPIAEGCGQRATYLPGDRLRLSSIVPAP